MTRELKPTIRGNKGFGSTGISTCLVTIDNNDITHEDSNQSETKTYSYDDAVKQLGYDPIKEYLDVFSEKKPTELPPLRKINHTIDLINKDNTDICAQDAYDQAKHSYLSYAIRLMQNLS